MMNKNITIKAIDNILKAYTWLNQIDQSLYDLGLVETIFSESVDEHLNNYAQLGADLILSSIGIEENDFTEEIEDALMNYMLEIIYQISTHGFSDFSFFDENNNLIFKKHLVSAEDVYNLFSDKDFLASFFSDSQKHNFF